MNPTQRAEYLAETYADAILRLSYTYRKWRKAPAFRHGDISRP